MLKQEIFVLTFPPDFDGELHIHCTHREPRKLKVSFSVALQDGETSKDALLAVAKRIVEQLGLFDNHNRFRFKVAVRLQR